MIGFDTDVRTEILLGNAAFGTRAFAIPVSQQALPIIVIEEIMRGRLNVIWRKQHIRISTRDLRIAAICVAHDAILVSRNRRNFECVLGLKVKFWERDKNA